MAYSGGELFDDNMGWARIADIRSSITNRPPTSTLMAAFTFMTLFLVMMGVSIVICVESSLERLV
jgi:hypothetical protein